MKRITLDGGLIDFVGALDFDHTSTGLVPRRLPAWTRPQIPDILMDVVVQMPSGVRMRFDTTSTSIELDVMLTLLRQLPRELIPATFDLLVGGNLTKQAATTAGHLFTIGVGGTDDITFDEGEQTTIGFNGLPPGSKVIEIWLPQGAVVEIRELRVDDNADFRSAPDPTTPRWTHYGSSISHCMEAASPTGTWPAVAAREASLELVNLGLGGQCMLDQFVARTIRDLTSDVISLKVGINVVNGDTLRDRTFGPALHGFLDTIREGQPETPILVVSPIFCPPAEDHPGPTIMGPDGHFTTVAGLPDLRLTCLTLTKIRDAMASIVTLRRELGDTNLHYLNGMELFGPDETADLPDDLHPNAAGYGRIGHRFADLAFGPGGPLARHN
jgi:hypothetical protein